MVINATCILKGGLQANDGVIRLMQECPSSPTTLKGEISGLSPGLHAIHIHEYGDLTDGCTSAGGHYNPDNKNHGAPDSKERHVGDLGNIIANADGIAVINISDHLISLSGDKSIIGRSIVIHQDEDDMGLGGHADSLTTGHAGARVACGVIGLAKN